MSSCLFCAIAAGDIGSRQVYADDRAVAFLDIAPWHRGHTLVVPRHHVADLVSGEPTLAALAPAIDATARLLVARLGADGVNLLSSTGSVAGQEVFHLHVHLVPRYAAAPGLSRLIDTTRSTTGAELDEVHALLTAARDGDDSRPPAGEQ